MAEKRKVRFLKDHVNGIKKGNVSEFNIGRASYLVREKIAEYVGDKTPKTVKAEKAEPCKTC